MTYFRNLLERDINGNSALETIAKISPNSTAINHIITLIDMLDDVLGGSYEYWDQVPDSYEYKQLCHGLLILRDVDSVSTATKLINQLVKKVLTLIIDDTRMDGHVKYGYADLASAIVLKYNGDVKLCTNSIENINLSVIAEIDGVMRNFVVIDDNDGESDLIIDNLDRIFKAFDLFNINTMGLAAKFNIGHEAFPNIALVKGLGWIQY